MVRSPSGIPASEPVLTLRAWMTDTEGNVPVPASSKNLVTGTSVDEFQPAFYDNVHGIQLADLCLFLITNGSGPARAVAARVTASRRLRCQPTRLENSDSHRRPAGDAPAGFRIFLDRYLMLHYFTRDQIIEFARKLIAAKEARRDDAI